MTKLHSALACALLPTLINAQSVLLVTRSSELPDVLPGCLQDSYYGSYNSPLTTVFIPIQKCLETSDVLSTLESGHLEYLDFDPSQRELVWLQEDAIDSELKSSAEPFINSFSSWFEGVQAADEDIRRGDDDEQEIMQTLQESGPALHYVTSNSAIISLPSHIPSKLLDIPPYTSVHILERLSYRPLVDESRIMELLTKKIEFNPEVASVLSYLSTSRLRSYIHHLSGEDGEGILSRHSFSKGARQTANWLQTHLEASGTLCEQRPFLDGFAPNVVCRYPATTNATDRVILSAHYDSRGSFGYTRAPGADDDGSGTAHLLAIAHVIHSRKIKFERPVELVAFSGEEQGLLGSKAYAKKLRAENASVALMLQADMIGYRDSREPPQLGLPALIGSPAAAYLVSNISKAYAPELTVGYTYACCSDHQSFNEQGYAATQVFERAGPIIDPMYHQSGDLAERNGYDLEQIRSIAKVTFAAVLETAGFEIGKSSKHTPHAAPA